MPNNPREVRRIGVSLGQIAVARDEDDCLCISGLGSCIALVLYTDHLPVAAMAHVVLPDSGSYSDLTDPGRYADTAVPVLLEHLQRAGVNRFQVRAMLTGGAALLGLQQDVGQQNINAVRDALKRHNIPIAREEVGGGRGRTIEFHVGSRDLQVRELQRPDLLV